MRIWHITSEIPLPGVFSGGMGCHVWNISREQVRLGHEVEVYCPLKQAETRDGAHFKTWAYHVPKFEHECSFNIEAARRTVAKLFRECEIKPDIIHCHEWDSAPVALDLALYLGVPCVSTLHLSNTLNQEFMTPHHQELHSYFLWWEQEMMRRSDGMIAISAYYAKWIKMFNRGNAIRLIHNGIEISDFDSEPMLTPSGKHVAFFHGRLCGQKGIDLIVEAAKQSDDIYWILAGPIAAKEDGRCLEDGLLSDLKVLEREGKVSLPGMLSQSQIGAHLRVCDVAVYPHKRAPFDCAALEAMACGAAVVTTGIDAIAEYATNGTTALFCEPTARDLLLKVRTLCAQHEKRRELGYNAKYAAMKFTWKETTRKTMQFYEDILNGKDSTSSKCAYKRGEASRGVLDEAQA